MDEDETDEISAPTVLVHRIDTHLGTILAQHLGTSVFPDSSASKPPHKRFDTSFLHAEKSKDCYRIIGTYWPRPTVAEKYDYPAVRPKAPVVDTLYEADSSDSLNNALDAADLYVLHLIDDDGSNELFNQTEQLLALIQSRSKVNKKKKTIVVVSSLMTWAKTKTKNAKKKKAQEDDDEEDAKPLAEDIFRRRKPHPDFKKLYDLEKSLLQTAKESKRRITATVIGTGIIYGCGEHDLHWMFRDAWENAPDLKMLGDGKNVVPMIHAKDLAQVVQNALENKPAARYIVAVDDGNISLKQLTLEISSGMGSGGVTKCTAEDVIHSAGLSQKDLDVLTADLPFQGTTIKDGMKIEWTAEEGFKSSIKGVMKEYRTLRNLTPIKVIVLGPPFSGKTTTAKRIAEFYKLHYIETSLIVSKRERELTDKIAEGKVKDRTSPAENLEENAENQEENAEDGRKSIADAEQLLDEITASKNDNAGQVSSELLLRIIRDKLLSRPCQNQGYVMDGYPTTYQEAKDLFAPTEQETELEEDDSGNADAEQEEKDEEEGEKPATEKRTAADHIFYLDIPMDMAKTHKMAEQEHAGSPESLEDLFKRRYSQYRQHTTDEENVLNFFDDTGNHAQWLTVTAQDTAQLDNIFSAILRKVGKPHNYGLTEAEKMVAAEKKAAERKQRLEEEQIKNREEEETSKPQRLAQEKQWQEMLETLQLEEHARRELSAMPTHVYLLRYVLPTIHEGLMKCAKVLPADPVDFLAEYLLQQGKMSILTEPAERVPDREVASMIPSGEEKPVSLPTDPGVAYGNSTGDKQQSLTDSKNSVPHTDRASEDTPQFLTTTAHRFSSIHEELNYFITSNLMADLA